METLQRLFDDFINSLFQKFSVEEGGSDNY